jgi:hypothetical protein
MKHFIIKISATIFFVATTNAQVQNPGIFLHNAYGTSIIYKKGGEGETVLGNLAKVKLFHMGHALAASIRTNKYLSSFTDITPQLQEISISASNHPQQDAVIYIKPSKLYQGWDISIAWEDNVELISLDPFSVTEQIKKIHNASWNKETKVYVLQLLWWTLEQLIPLVKKGTTPAEIKKNNLYKKELVNKSLDVIRALKVYNATAPGIQHNPGQKRKPLFTYTNVQLPQNMDTRLREFISKQLESTQQ